MSATGHQRRRRMTAAEQVINSGADLAQFVREHGLNCEPTPESVYEEVMRRGDYDALREDAMAPPAPEAGDGPELHEMRAAEVRAHAEEMLGYDPGTKKAAIAALEAE